ncbi:MAG: HlyD family type I secretion periplasmic adaptor subunit [Magnetococcales bacterium]|nr:HlyD family type I secretion periplasmic adaptor subunit [Magnetococcales bacterium]
MNTPPITPNDRGGNTPNATREKRLAPGDFIFKEGEVGQLAYVVVSGVVEVCKLSGGNYVKLQELKEGTMFGEMAIIEKTARSASARAVTDVIVREIDEQALMAHIRRSPEVAMNMMHRLASYVRSSHDSLSGSTFEKLKKDPTPSDKVEVIESDGRPEKWQTDIDFILNEFQSPKEILERRPFPPILIGMLVVIIALLVIIVFWSSFSIIDTTVSARGRLSTSVPTISVQATDSSVVKNVLVSVGDLVKKGDVLVTLDETFTESDYARTQMELDTLKTKIQRLTAEMNREGVESAKQIGNEIERRVYLNRTAEYSARITSFDLDMRALEQKLYTTANDIRLANQQLGIQKELEEARLKLYQQKVGSYVNLLAAREKHLTTARSFQNLQDSIGEYNSKIEAIRAKKQAFISQWFSSIGKQLSQAIELRNSKLEEMVKVGRRRENVAILAPADGTIMELNDLFIGAIVNKGATVMALVPGNVPLNAEIDINPRDIGNVMMGAEVSLKLDALPFQKHGDLAGEITFISEDTVDTSTDGKPGTYYRAIVTIMSDDLRDLPVDFRLIPGMLLSGDILAGRRRLITYFIYPVIRTIKTSFSEP